MYSPKRQIPGEKMGYLTYFLDSEKNVMGLWAMN
jgi:predicted enzyme related to lactoylglutathione lyase